jgi:hypothetical protein
VRERGVEFWRQLLKVHEDNAVGLRPSAHRAGFRAEFPCRRRRTECHAVLYFAFFSTSNFSCRTIPCATICSMSVNDFVVADKDDAARAVPFFHSKRSPDRGYRMNRVVGARSKVRKIRLFRRVFTSTNWNICLRSSIGSIVCSDSFIIAIQKISLVAMRRTLFESLSSGKMLQWSS